MKAYKDNSLLTSENKVLADLLVKSKGHHPGREVRGSG